MIKSLSVALMLTLTSLVIVAAAPATATTFEIESCTSEGKTCKTTSVGTVLKSTGGEFVLEAEGKIFNECSFSFEAEVLDSVTEKAGDDLEVAVTSAAFTECSKFEMEAEELPWIEEADAVEFEQGGALEVRGLTYSIAGCSYATGGIHRMFSEVKLFKAESLTTTTGSMLLTEGWFLCPGLIKPLFHSVIQYLGDASFPEAKEIRIT